VIISESGWPQKAYADAAEREATRGRPRPLNYASSRAPLVSQGAYDQTPLDQELIPLGDAVEEALPVEPLTPVPAQEPAAESSAAAAPPAFDVVNPAAMTTEPRAALVQPIDARNPAAAAPVARPVGIEVVNPAALSPAPTPSAMPTLTSETPLTSPAAIVP
jgi:hypothetical protein